MSCEFCKNFKGLNDICEDGFHYVETGNESLDCQSYQYNGKLKYYSYLSKKDELEVKQIIGRVVSYIIKIGFDDMSIATQSLACSIFDNINQMETREGLH